MGEVLVEMCKRKSSAGMVRMPSWLKQANLPQMVEILNMKQSDELDIYFITPSLAGKYAGMELEAGVYMSVRRTDSSPSVRLWDIDDIERIP